MFRGEKNTNREGGYRVPMMMRWPGKIKPGTVVNEIGAHSDLFTTLIAAAGNTTAVEDLKAGKAIGDVTCKTHIDGNWLQSFRDFPPRQKPGSFNLQNVMQTVMAGTSK